jgi:hypothetical protein
MNACLAASLHLYVCPSVCLSICMSVHLYVCPSVCLSICMSVHLSAAGASLPSVHHCLVCLSVCLSMSVCLCTTICLRMSLSVQVWRSISTCLSVCPYLSVFACLCPCKSDCLYLHVCLSVHACLIVCIYYTDIIYLSFSLALIPFQTRYFCSSRLYLCHLRQNKWTQFTKTCTLDISKRAWVETGDKQGTTAFY